MNFTRHARLKYLETCDGDTNWFGKGIPQKEKGWPKKDHPEWCKGLSDQFIKPYSNIEAAKFANGGAYPPDMSVLIKARKGGANYIYSLILGYEDPPEGFEIEDGVYYNKYMPGHKIKMPKVLYKGLVDYADGTEATEQQIAKDVVTFLTWVSEPHLEARHKTGFKVILYLFILVILVYFSMKKIWSRTETKV